MAHTFCPNKSQKHKVENNENKSKSIGINACANDVIVPFKTYRSPKSGKYPTGRNIINNREKYTLSKLKQT